MDLNVIFKIAATGITVSLLNTLLSKAGRDEYVMLTTLAGIIIIILMLTDEIRGLFSALEKLMGL